MFTSFSLVLGVAFFSLTISIIELFHKNNIAARKFQRESIRAVMFISLISFCPFRMATLYFNHVQSVFFSNLSNRNLA